MLRKLWSRLTGIVSRIFRREPVAGRYEADSRSALRGSLATAPFIWPSREYLVYVPRGHRHWRRAPLLVLIHGCRQKAEEIAEGTRVTTLADELGCLVLLPRQNPRANQWGCWNWFDGATERGWGETAIVAAQVRAVRRKYRIDRKRVFVAGMSAGGALAAVLGMRRPELVAGVFIHSGIACGAASSGFAAFNVLKRGADTDVVAIGRHARDAAPPRTLPVPLLALQGAQDDVVAPINAAQLVRQYLALNGHPAADIGARDALPTADQLSVETLPDARIITTSDWRVADKIVVRHVLVDGLGHAWSGGDDRHPYNDPRGPDATALLSAFVKRAMQ
jgi:poly(hydroxyalkanoate) depolymerase family esterase